MIGKAIAPMLEFVKISILWHKINF